MYLDWALLHWCFSLLCLMGAPGLPGLVGQMGREVPGPIWVLNGLSPVCLPSWFPSHVTWPRSERSPWLHSPGSSHQVCFNPAAHRKQLRAAISYTAVSVAMTQEVHLYPDEESICPRCLIFTLIFSEKTLKINRTNMFWMCYLCLIPVQPWNTGIYITENMTVKAV